MECCCGYTTFILLILAYKFLDWFVRRFYVGRYDDRYILVTGCDMGFGNEIAKRLDAKGCHVFAGCLTEAGETDLKKTGSNRLHPISMDVTKPESVRRAFETVKGLLPPGKGLWGLLNNAGILGPVGVLESQRVEDYKGLAAVNLYGMIDVTLTFLPLIKISHGRVVNTSSIVGRHTVQGCVPYCVSKYGVESFTDGLRRSLYLFNCKAIMIEPGIHMTHFMSRANIEHLATTAWNKADPAVREEYGEEYFQYSIHGALDNLYRVATYTTDLVVNAYEHALLGTYPRARYLVGRDAKFFWMPLQYLPEWLGDWVLSKLDPNLPLPAVLARRQ